VFCTLENASYGDCADLEPVACCAETEGLTLVLPRSTADGAGLTYTGVFRRITLDLSTSLQETGLTARVAASLAARGIAANVIAAYFHDHIFVPAERAAEAVGILSGLSV